MRPVKLRHFTPDEFARPTGDWYQHMSAGHLVRIDILRDWWGAPISTSGHRDAVGREDDSNSYHNIRKHGIVRACDYRPSGIKTVSEARRFFLLAQQVGFKGIGFYLIGRRPGFTSMTDRRITFPLGAACWFSSLTAGTPPSTFRSNTLSSTSGD